MKRMALRDVIAGVDGIETQWLLDDLELPGTTGLVRFEQMNPHSPNYGQVTVKACGLMHSYATVTIAWGAPPGWSTNSKMEPVGYCTTGAYGIDDTGADQRAALFMPHSPAAAAG